MDVFSKSETDVGLVPNYEASVSLKRDIKDVNVKFNQFPAAVREKVGTILRRYRKIGIISYAGDDIKDPIVSNLLAIMKPNKQIRACFDARFINYVTAKGKCFHRSLTQTLRDIDLNGKYFCILDLSAAYFCIAIHPDSRRLFCFRDDKNKLNCFARIPQGFVSSDQHLSAVLERVFPPDLPANERPVSYQDDFILSSRG